MATIDITVPLSDKMPCYPGDPPFARQSIAEINMGGGGARVSTLSLSAHAGTHVDAPAHFLPHGATLDALPVDFFSGPAQVIAYAGPLLNRDAITAMPLRAGEFALFRTSNSELWHDCTFHQDYVALDASGAEALLAAGVRGVGIDYLSVERPDNGGIVHRILLQAGLAVIEGLDLSLVAPGRYELICLPLCIAGAEGAPARAALRPLGA